MSSSDSANKPPKIADYLALKIEASGKTQKTIARELGYTNANIISMFKTGETKVPIEKIPGIAASLNVDPAHLFRLAVGQYWHDREYLINEIFGGIISQNEKAIIEVYRSVTHGRDPALDGNQLQRLRAFFDDLVVNFNSGTTE